MLSIYSWVCGNPLEYGLATSHTTLLEPIIWCQCFSWKCDLIPTFLSMHIFCLAWDFGCPMHTVFNCSEFIRASSLLFLENTFFFYCWPLSLFLSTPLLWYFPVWFMAYFTWWNSQRHHCQDKEPVDRQDVLISCWYKLFSTYNTVLWIVDTML